MSRLTIWAASFLMTSALTGVPSAKASEGVTIFGYGTQSCGRFISVKTTSPVGKTMGVNIHGETFYNEAALYDAWIKGWLSAQNARSAQDGQKDIDTDFEAVDLWLRNYCTANPTATLLKALYAFINEWHSK